MNCLRLLKRSLLLAVLIIAGASRAVDWPMRGKDASRNAVSLERNAPVDWQIGTKTEPSRNVLWSARLGTYSLGDPVIADGLVWVGTNNDPPRDPTQKQDATVLMCFRERDGQFLYQYVSPRLERGKRFDWDYSSLASSPLVEGDRLWFCNNRCEVVCLDIGPLRTGQGQPRLVWKIDLRKELGVLPKAVMIGNNAIHCSVASHGDRIYVNTTNARYLDNVPAPNAPSLVCFQKSTGQVVWTDNSPGENILEVQHGSPLVIEIDGRGQVIMGQGDGWLRSFDALTGALLWKFDINFKEPRRELKAGQWLTRGNLNYFVATPVFYKNRVYIAGGRHAEWGDGPGRLCCIDPMKREDVSSELDDGTGQGKPNPNSALVWEYLGRGQDKMHRSLSSVAIDNNLVIAPDRNGLIHCLDARSGEVQWVHNAKAGIYASPLIVDGKVYIGDEDGDFLILELAREKTRIVERNFGKPIYASPVYANGVLYVMTAGDLYAIRDSRR